jgi:DNA-binding transcriptional ArsR family regulator
VLRIHFTGEDLAATRLASSPDPLWELTLSSHALRSKRSDPVLASWKQQAAQRLLPGSQARQKVEALIAANPARGYFPDLLTPEESSQGLEAGLDALMHTSKRRLRSDVSRLADSHGRLTQAVADIGDGRPAALKELAGAARFYYDEVLGDVTDRIRTTFDADRRRRAQILLDGGVGALLNSLHPNVAFDGTVLEIADYAGERDLHLNGRGLRLVPSYFKLPDKPITLADPDLPQVLVYSIDRMAGLVAAAAREPVSALLGRTRAALLEATILGGSTTELARRVNISPAAASQHLAVLREAGMVISTRDANMMRHTATSLGNALFASRGAAA